MRKVDEYSKQADANRRKSAHDFQVGDFIKTATACGKDVNFYDFIDAREFWHMGSIDRLCKIVDIVDVPEDDDFLNNWMSTPAPSHLGGSQSDDVDTDDMFSLKKEDYETFFDLITVYRKPSGKWIGVDCQGYDYWRYVHLPCNYDVVFAEERSDALRQLADKEAKRKAERMAELSQHAKALADRENELKMKYFGLVLSPANGRIVGNNIRKFLAIEFPGIKFKVSIRRSYLGTSHDVSVEVFGVEDEAKRDEIRKVCKVWTDTMPTGMIDDYNDYRGECESRRCPMGIFGYVSGSFSFIFQ